MSEKWGTFLMVKGQLSGMYNAEGKKICIDDIQIAVKGGGAKGIKASLRLQIEELYSKERSERSSAETIRKLKELITTQDKTIGQMKKDYDWAKQDALEQFEEMVEQTSFVDTINKTKMDKALQTIEAMKQTINELKPLSIGWEQEIFE